MAFAGRRIEKYGLLVDGCVAFRPGGCAFQIICYFQHYYGLLHRLQLIESGKCEILQDFQNLQNFHDALMSFLD